MTILWVLTYPNFSKVCQLRINCGSEVVEVNRLNTEWFARVKSTEPRITFLMQQEQPLCESSPFLYCPATAARIPRAALCAIMNRILSSCGSSLQNWIVSHRRLQPQFTSVDNIGLAPMLKFNFHCFFCHHESDVNKTRTRPRHFRERCIDAYS